MKLTCLYENTTQNPALIPNHGFAVLIEVGGKTILFDFGQTPDLLTNALALGGDLSKVDVGVLSHGHYDHAGGISSFLQKNTRATVYLHKQAFGAYYNVQEKYIGVDPLLQNHPRLQLVEIDTPLVPGVTLRMAKPTLVTPLYHGTLTQKLGNTFSPDPFDHELYLQVEEGENRVIFSGCAHKGVGNILSWFEPTHFVGGMHLSHFPCDQTLITLATRLQQFPTRFYTGHCTGQEQFSFLEQKGLPIFYLSCGEVVEI